MTANNLAIVMAPCLVRSSDLKEDIELCKSSNANCPPVSPTWVKSSNSSSHAQPSTLTSVLSILIEEYDKVFDGTGRSTKPERAPEPASRRSPQSSPDIASKGTKHIFAGTVRKRVNGQTHGVGRPSVPSRASVQGIFAGNG